MLQKLIKLLPTAIELTKTIVGKKSNKFNAIIVAIMVLAITIALSYVDAEQIEQAVEVASDISDVAAKYNDTK